MKKFTWLLVAALWLAASPVWAVLVTQMAQVQAEATSGNPVGLNPPLDHVNVLGFGTGRTYTNSTAITQINGDFLAQDLRSVGMMPLSDGEEVAGEFFGGIQTPDGNTIIAIFGIQGRVFELDNAKFTEGWLGFYEHSGSFSAMNPTTWDLDNSDMTLLAEYVLKEQFLREGDDVPKPGVRPDGPVEPVYAGPFGATVSLDADLNNVSGVSSADPNQAGIGNFIFIENPDEQNQTFIDTTYIDGDGDPHLPPPMPGLIPKPTGQMKNGLPLFVEGLMVETDQRILDPQPDLTEAHRVSLNKIGMKAFGDIWAAGIGENPNDPGDDTWFDNSNPAMTGDFVARVAGTGYPVAQYMVPEPSTVAAWGFGWLLIVGWGAARRRRQRRS